MKPYTITGMYHDAEDLRGNWRGNLCSQGRQGDKGGKGRISYVCEIDGETGLKIGNRNYHRKKADRASKKVYRTRLKQEMIKEFKEFQKES